MFKNAQVREYEKHVSKIREKAKEYGLSDLEIDEIFTECSEVLRNEDKYSTITKHDSASSKFMRFLAGFLSVLFIFYILLNVHQPTASLVLRNVQIFIYPVLKLLRYISVPIVERFPDLTHLYDESCLVENPYFYVSDMDCWPCESVHSVIDLTGFNNQTLYQTGAPFITKTYQKHVAFNDIKEMYLNNTDVFLTDAKKLSSNTKLTSVKDFETFSPNLTSSSKTHISWRMNRMKPGRLIRKLFPRPYFISEWSGQSIERYILIDEPFAEAYTLPNLECSYALLVQGSGERTIILKPSRECGQYCRTVSVVLRPSYVLWYNWWYWRPISMPGENTQDASISYLTSYC